MKSKRPANLPKNEKPKNDNNFYITIAGMILFTALASFAVAYISGFILSSFQDSHAMAMLITADGVKSDDKTLEHNLNTATQALITCRDLGWALAIGSVGMSVALFIRYWSHRSQGDSVS